MGLCYEHYDPAAATPLDKQTTERVTKAIQSSKIAKEYKSLKVNNKVHSDLLGGLIVDFGDEKSIDLSVKSRVQKLDQLITRELSFLSFFLSSVPSPISFIFPVFLASCEVCVFCCVIADVCCFPSLSMHDTYRICLKLPFSSKWLFEPRRM